jgi:hypothetical protein
VLRKYVLRRRIVEKVLSAVAVDTGKVANISISFLIFGKNLSSHSNKDSIAFVGFFSILFFNHFNFHVENSSLNTVESGYKLS